MARNLPDFHARYPDIQLDLGVSDRMVDQVGDSVDCVVRGGEIRDQSLIARRGSDLRLGVHAALGYLARAGVPTHPQALEDSHHRVVGFVWSGSGKTYLYDMCSEGQQVQIQGRYALAVDDGNADQAAGLAGMGILWLPHYMALPHLGTRELIPLFEDWSLDPMPLYVAYPLHRHVSAQARAFIDWVAALMALHTPLMRPGGSQQRPKRSQVERGRAAQPQGEGR